MRWLGVIFGTGVLSPEASVPLSERLGGRGPGVGGGRHGLPGPGVHRLRDVREVSHRAPQYRGP